MADFEYLVRYLEAAEPELKDYLLSNNVYWNLAVRPPAGMPPYPRFTLGRLLLFQRQLSAAGPQAGGAEVLEKIAALRERWRSAWAGKAAAEFGVRLNEWTRFIEELRADPAAQRSRYRYEVERRAILALLEEEADAIPADQRGVLGALDAALKGKFKPGPFIMGVAYQPAFPEGEYWYLFGGIR